MVYTLLTAITTSHCPTMKINTSKIVFDLHLVVFNHKVSGNLPAEAQRNSHAATNSSHESVADGEPGSRDPGTGTPIKLLAKYPKLHWHLQTKKIPYDTSAIGTDTTENKYISDLSKTFVNHLELWMIMVSHRRCTDGSVINVIPIANPIAKT